MEAGSQRAVVRPVPRSAIGRAIAVFLGPGRLHNRTQIDCYVPPTQPVAGPSRGPPLDN